MKRCLVCLFLSFVFCLDAAIHEISQMHEILPFVDAKTWLVFDIDNTLIEAQQMLGSDQWYTYQSARMQDLPQEEKSRLAKELKTLYKKVQVLAKMQPVEEDTPKLLQDMQEKGLSLMALTARFPLTLINITLQHLKHANIDFKKTAPYPGFFEFLLQDPVKYRNGVLFVGDNDKGKAFVAFLNELKLKPQRVIFVDDKIKHVQAMQTALEEIGIAFEGFRYSYTDEKVRNFDPQIAELQQVLLQRVLNDNEARLLLDKQSFTGF